MSCCGHARAPVEMLPPRRELPTVERPFLPAMVTFIYTGATRLIAEGPLTRRRYRFNHPGALIEVDGRDAASFAAVPCLRRVARASR